MEAAAREIGRILGQFGKLTGLICLGLLAGASVIVLGTKAIVLVPALAVGFLMFMTPYSPLYVIVACIPINVVIAGPITVIRLAIVFGLFVAAIQGLKGQAPRLHIPLPEGGLPLCYFVWLVFSTIAVSEGELVARLGGFFIYAVVFFMILVYVDCIERFRRVLITMVIVGLLQVGLVMLEALFNIVPFGGFQAELAADRGGEEVRAVGASVHPIFLAAFFQISIVLAIVLMHQAKSASARLFLLTCAGLFLMGWITAWSRSTWIGMLMMIGVALLLWTRATRILAVILGLVAFVVLAAHDFSMAEVLRSVDSLAAVQRGSFRAGVSGSSQSFSWRTENWLAAVSIWASSPIFGVGIDRVDLFMPEHLPPGAIGHRFIAVAIPHNMFLQMLAEAGLPAFLMFTALWISAFAAVFRAWKVDHLRPYAFAMLVIMCGQCTTYFFNPIPREIWFSMAMSLVLGRLAREHRLMQIGSSRGEVRGRQNEGEPALHRSEGLQPPAR